MKNWEKIKVNPKSKKIQIQRSRINDLIRDFFKKRRFLEIQTPTLVKCADQESHLSLMEVNFKDEKNKKYRGFLIASPEYSLKKLLVAGFDKIFELAKVFRSNEGFGGVHNPEFTMLEWYRANSNYRQIMEDVEQLVYFLNKKINRSNYLNYQEKRINLTPPWPKLSVKEAFLKYADINLDKAKNLKSFKNQANSVSSLGRRSMNDWNDIFYGIFLNEIEPRLPKNRPIIIYDYPLPQASLAKRKISERNPSHTVTLGKLRDGSASSCETDRNSFYVERFEVYIGGLELANAFSELTDAKEQFERLKREQILRKKMKKNYISIDKDFIYALKLGMPPSGGIALGLERLQMLLLDIKDINDLLPFPVRQMFS